MIVFLNANHSVIGCYLLLTFIFVMYFYRRILDNLYFFIIDSILVWPGFLFIECYLNTIVTYSQQCVVYGY